MVKVSLFSQMLNLIPRDKFDRLVSRHASDKHQKGINSGTRSRGPIWWPCCSVTSAELLLCAISVTA